MERLLVTSIDSLIGSNLALALADRCEVLGLYDRCALASPALRTAPWSPDDPAALESYVDSWQPQWIVHSGPLSAASWEPAPCAQQGEREPRVVAHLADVAERWGCRLTVISSDAVFTGPCLFHDESSPATNPAPRAVYARNVERILESREALVVRTHAYGWDFDDAGAGFARQAFRALVGPACWEPFSADGRRHATPILATDLAELLLRAYETHLQGLYHLSGAERTSPYRFAAELAAALGVSVPHPPTEQLPPAARWHAETSLSSKRARRMLAVATPLLRDGLNRFAEQAAGGWPSMWHRVEANCATEAVAA